MGYNVGGWRGRWPRLCRADAWRNVRIYGVMILNEAEELSNLETAPRAEVERLRARLEQAERDLQQARATMDARVAEKSRKLTAIYEIILLSSGTLDICQILTRCLDYILQTVGGAAALIYEVDHATDQLYLLVSRGFDPEALQPLSILPGGWLAGEDITLVLKDLPRAAHLPEALRLGQFASFSSVPIHWDHRVSGAIGIYWAEPTVMPVEEIALLNAIGDQLGVVLENNRLRERIEELAVRKERRRLARELHDSVTQAIHSLVLSSDTSLHRLQAGRLDKLEQSLEHMAASARQALKDMRLLLYELRLVRLEEIRLHEALQARIESVEQRSGIEANLAIEEGIVWPPGWQGEIYALIMEAMNNSLKYSRSPRIDVAVRMPAAGLDVRIVDYGVGFNPEEVGPGGLGLKTMAERAERLGGRFELRSSPGTGTMIHVQAARPAGPLEG
jgi:two-component system, NarL family, nitrate/nitrite sensor histidine kinase NarX